MAATRLCPAPGASGKRRGGAGPSRGRPFPGPPSSRPAAGGGEGRCPPGRYLPPGKRRVPGEATGPDSQGLRGAFLGGPRRLRVTRPGRAPARPPRMAAEPGTSEVRRQHRFDQGSLERYLSSRLPGFPRQPAGALAVRQYSSGQSNPTFYLQKGGQAFVLRKKPHGPLLPGAHKVDREYRVQKALFSAGFPVPEPLLYCSDVSIIGTEFYVMQHVQGRIFRDISLPEVGPAERSALYLAMIETLALLHSFDLQSLGLQGYGRGPGYCKRQVSTWKKQYDAAAHTDIPAMNKLAEWLANNLPPDDNEETLIHGDFRIDNIIFHPTEARVLAVLDWELSTTGHPLADLAYATQFYFWPTSLKDLGQGSVLGFKDTIETPSFEELVSIYCRCRRIPTTLPNLNFFLALSYFKMAGIAQGVYARYLIGNASAENSHEFAKLVEPLAERGLELSRRSSFSSTQHSISGELFHQSRKGQEILLKVKQFMKQHIYPAEKEIIKYYTEHRNAEDKWKKPPLLERLKELAKAEGLWNLFLPDVSGLSQLDYALIAEETGRCLIIAPEVFNCHAPDTGNMEVLHMYGTEEQKKEWLEPLLEGKISSCFCMTEPDVASSDATNMQCTIERDGNSYVINGKKWWSSGAGNPNCKVAIVMGKTKNSSASRYKQHSMIIVPMDTPGLKLIRPLSVFGYMDEIHGGHFEIHFNDVRVPVSNIILGEGRGFEIAQGRLGPGRIHHCMRSLGAAEAALEILCQRAAQRETFGKKLYQHEVVAHWIAECRLSIEQARLLTLQTARKIDMLGNRRARREVAMTKVVVPRAVLKVIDCAVQVCGGAGVSQDFPLAFMFASIRTLRLADGPDEVHLSTIARWELLDQSKKLTAKI
ncbi:acyl-CoA dehydrogenase family member 11 [Motacilla alba alba]|uniref:acyl-CoA dehydrogenase family member 11 n=1 Tax=Motacilla alba alba TaxID=1094192 RepID=UPI0018D598EF|nr:acyl-CoA dehydrogenase family member 11 [Motacilla alba alba]